jgi:YHS domain-containing protein
MNTIAQPIKNTGMEIEEEGMIMDLVCGMELSKVEAKLSSEYKGKTYYFCSQGCKTHFDNDPEKYAD